MSLVSSERDSWENTLLPVTDCGKQDAFDHSMQEISLPVLFGCPVFRPAAPNPQSCNRSNFEEADKFSPTMGEDLVDSMLETCFQTAGGGSCVKQAHFDNSVDICIPIQLEQCPSQTLGENSMTEFAHSYEFVNDGDSHDEGIEETLRLLEKDDSREGPQDMTFSGVALDQALYPSQVVVDQKACPRALEAGRISKKKKSRAPARPWSDEEHQRFKESLELFGRNWERCAAYIGTRRAQLVRSHAQKYLIKLWKLGEPLPKKVAESGNGYTLSGKPLHADSASAKSYLTKIPCPSTSQK